MLSRFVHGATLGLVIACFCVLSLSAFSQQAVFSIDPAHSSVTFTLPDVLHTVHGTFDVRPGNISFNRASGRMEGHVSVNAASGTSGNKVRDERMAKDELRAKTFPVVSFAPAQLYGLVPTSGDATVMVHGVFTLLGQDHPLQVPFKVHVQGQACTATGDFNVPYVSWGLKDPSTFLLKVAKEVKIQVLLQGELR
jgi:polyisoprenoid-binding protein YceI